METSTPHFFELGPSWHSILKEELTKPYIARLASFVEQERYGKQKIYPPKELVFNAFKTTPYEKVKVLIIGQDPYHGSNQAHGLCFSVPEGTPPPPSLQNIFKELASDLSINTPSHGCLLSWAKQGVMLLNATLTVREGEPLSHHKKGWEQFTDAVVLKLSEREDPVIFVLWGKSAQEKYKCIQKTKEENSRHPILTSSHPSPLSAYQGFMGCRHFSKINELLLTQNKTPIDWQI